MSSDSEKMLKEENINNFSDDNNEDDPYNKSEAFFKLNGDNKSKKSSIFSSKSH